MKKAGLAVMAAASVLFCLAPEVFAAKKVITVAMWRNDPPTAKFTQNILTSYGKAHGFDVKFVYAPWNGFLDKLLAMAAAGQIPDVMVVERRWLPRFADNKLIRPLDDVITADKFDPKAKLSDNKSGTYKKRFYGFPIWGGPALHYYNPALFTAAGVPDPNNLIEANRWNWDTFVEYGKKLTKDTNGDGKPDTYALESVSTWSPDWVGKIRQAGGDIFDETYKKVLIKEPAAQEGLQYWVDLANRYNIAPRAGNYVGFDTKKAAMRGGWLSEAVTWKEAYKKKGIDMQLTLYPAGKSGFVTVAGGCPVAVSANTKYPKDAYQLAKWFAMESDEWKNTGVPASKATYEGAYQEFLSKYFSHPSSLIKKAMENVDPEPCIHPRHQLIEEAQAANLQPLLAGKISVAQATSKLADELLRIVNRK